MRSPLAVLPAFILVAAGCVDGAPSADVHVDELPVLSLTEEGRIGSVADPDTGFSRVAAMAMDHHGHVLAWDLQDPGIRMYDRDGHLLRQLGGAGEGPGEFAGAARFGAHGDTVWAIDLRLRRITLFDHDGEVLSARSFQDVRVPLPGCVLYVGPWTMRSDGLFSSTTSRKACPRDEPPSGVQPGDSIPVPSIVFDGTGTVVDTVGWASHPNPRMYNERQEEHRRIEVAGRSISVPQPPPDLPWWQPLAVGRIVIDAPYATDMDVGVMRVTRLDEAEDTVFNTSVAYRPPPYGDAELNAVAEGAARMGSRSVGSGPAPEVENADAIARRLRTEMEFPPVQLPIQYTWLGQDESVWLLLTDGYLTAAWNWLVVQPDGTPRGVVRLPRVVYPQWTGDDVLWAAVPDDVGVPWLVRYRIEG